MEEFTFSVSDVLDYLGSATCTLRKQRYRRCGLSDMQREKAACCLFQKSCTMQ